MNSNTTKKLRESEREQWIKSALDSVNLKGIQREMVKAHFMQLLARIDEYDRAFSMIEIIHDSKR